MTSSELRILIGAPPGARSERFAVRAIAEDSRRAVPGALFVAHRGGHVDGNDYIADAVARGAVAVLGDLDRPPRGCPAPYVTCASLRAAAGLVAQRLAGDPSHALDAVGVTGTNGKTSVCRLTQGLLEAAGRPAANFGTVGYFIGGRHYPAAHTTPFASDLAQYLREARDAGMKAVAMEASSHALDQDRVSGIRFRVGAFTNLTQDHLDYHGDMKTYRKAKEKLFRMLGCGAFGVVNLEDAAAAHMIAAAGAAPCITFGKGGDVRAKKIVLSAQGTSFELKTPWGKGAARIQLVGAHNVSNALCAVAIAGGLGVDFGVVVGALAEIPCVAGRFERVDAGQDFLVVVDYAHTEDGLRNALAAARALAKKRVICVFGCGGDRDAAKRPKMGAAAAELADYAVLTSDNPRTEDPIRILLDVEVGLQRKRKKGADYEVIEDRAAAIRAAVRRARKGDVVLIAGKGHEDYQIVGTVKHPFDDRVQARAALAELDR